MVSNFEHKNKHKEDELFMKQHNLVMKIKNLKNAISILEEYNVFYSLEVLGREIGILIQNLESIKKIIKEVE